MSKTEHVRATLERVAIMGADCATWEVRNAALHSLDNLACCETPADFDAMTTEIGEAFAILAGCRWPAADAALIDCVVDACGIGAVMA